MHITANFDAGNIDVISLEDKKDIQLAIRPDVGEAFFQWFNFRLTGQVGEQYILNIINAGEASYVSIIIRLGFKRAWAIERQDRCGLTTIVRLRN